MGGKLAGWRLDAAIIILLYLTCIYLWTLPIKSSQIPYGETDAVSHFKVADYMASVDKPMFWLPNYIDFRYGPDNLFKHHTLWYHPPFHVNIALAEIFAGRVVPFYLMLTLMCSVTVISVYFVTRKLLGTMPAALASLLTIFAGREYMPFLWGQWPERVSYALIILVAYCVYRYLNLMVKNKPALRYAVMGALLMGVQLYMHPTGLFHSVLTIFILWLFFAIKHRRLIFKPAHLAVFAIVFLLLSMVFPFQSLNVVVRLGLEKNPHDIGNISRLFSWFKKLDYDAGLPERYFSYAEMNGSWTIPLALAGSAFLLLRRKKQDMFFIAMIIAFYIMTHLDFIGSGRVHRSLSAEASVIYPVIALGLMGFASLVSQLTGGKNKQTIKYLAAAVFIYFALTVNGASAYKQLSQAYPVGVRMTPGQVEAAEWIGENLAEDAGVIGFGHYPANKVDWTSAYARRLVNDYIPAEYNATHILIDYTDSINFGIKPLFEQLQSLENVNLSNKTPIYKTEAIRVYEIEERK